MKKTITIDGKDYQVKARPAQVRTLKPWTIEEEAQLRQLATQHTAREIAKVLGRSKSAIKRKAQTMGIKPWPSKRERLAQPNLADA